MDVSSPMLLVMVLVFVFYYINIQEVLGSVFIPAASPHEAEQAGPSLYGRQRLCKNLISEGFSCTAFVCVVYLVLLVLLPGD